jgi:hypothetical protein
MALVGGDARPICPKGDVDPAGSIQLVETGLEMIHVKVVTYRIVL